MLTSPLDSMCPNQLCPGFSTSGFMLHTAVWSPKFHGLNEVLSSVPCRKLSTIHLEAMWLSSLTALRLSSKGHHHICRGVKLGRHTREATLQIFDRNCTTGCCHVYLWRMGWSCKWQAHHGACGLLDNLLPGDVLADRGFSIADSMGFYCARSHLPAYTKGKKQLLAAEVESTRRLANVRIHVERVIGLIRNKFLLLKCVVPIEYVTCRQGDNLLH